MARNEMLKIKQIEGLSAILTGTAVSGPPDEIIIGAGLSEPLTSSINFRYNITDGLYAAGPITLPSLSGSGTQMVVTDNSGVLGIQDIPVGVTAPAGEIIFGAGSGIEPVSNPDFYITNTDNSNKYITARFATLGVNNGVYGVNLSGFGQAFLKNDTSYIELNRVDSPYAAGSISFYVNGLAFSNTYTNNISHLDLVVNRYARTGSNYGIIDIGGTGGSGANHARIEATTAGMYLSSGSSGGSNEIVFRPGWYEGFKMGTAFSKTYFDTNGETYHEIENLHTGTSAYASLILNTYNDKYGTLRKFSDNYSGNFPGTSQSAAGFLTMHSDLGSSGVNILGSVILNAGGTTSTNFGTRLDSVGFRFDILSNLHATNVYPLETNIGGTYSVKWKNSVKFAGDNALYMNIQTPSTSNWSMLQTSAGTLMLNSPQNFSLYIQNNLVFDAFTGFNFTPIAATSGSSSRYLFRLGADTGQTASTEVIGWDFDGSTNNMQHATGTIAMQRDFVVKQRTHRFVGASTITAASTFNVQGLPTAGTNATISNFNYISAGSSQNEGFSETMYSAFSSAMAGSQIKERHFIGNSTNYGLAISELRAATGNGATQPMFQMMLYPGLLSLSTGNLSGTSIPVSSLARMNVSNTGWTPTGTDGTGPLALTTSVLYSIPGTTAANYGFRQDSTGLRIDQIQNLHTANTYPFSVAGNINVTAAGIIYGVGEQSFVSMQTGVNVIGCFSTRTFYYQNYSTLDIQGTETMRYDLTKTTHKVRTVIGTATPALEGMLNVISDNTTAYITSTGTGTYGAALSLVTDNSATVGAYLTKLSSGYTVNITGTSISYAGNLVMENQGGPVTIKNSAIYAITGNTATNLGTRTDATGFRIDEIGSLHTSNSIPFQIGSSAGGYAGMTYQSLFFTGPYTTSLLSRSADSSFGNPLGDGAAELSTSSTAGLVIGTISTKPIVFATSNVEQVRIASDGIVTVQSLSGTGDRMVQVDEDGVLSADTAISRVGGRIVIYDNLAISESGLGALRIGNVATTNSRDLSIYRNANGVVGFTIENNTAGTGNYVNINFGNSSTNGFGNANISRYDYSYSGNYAGTSVAYSDSFSVGNYVGNNGASGISNIVFKDSGIIGLANTTSTNYGFRADATGFRIGQISTLHTSNSYPFSIDGLVTYRPNYAYGRSGLVTDSTTVVDFNFYTGYIRGGTNGSGSIMMYPGSGGVFVESYLVPYILSRAAGDSIAFTEYSGGVDHGSMSFTGVAANSSLYWKGKLRAESELRVTAQAGTGDRLVQADANGIQTASTEIVAQYVTDSTVQTQLETPGNWDINFDFVGSPGITGTYQGQMHYDDNYLYMCVADDVWIRLTRG